jgi:phospho-N-acetylmuramoyl-pentapeptide-transferase
MISMLVAGAVSFLVTVVATPIAVRAFRERNLGQFIREEVEGHAHKHGTPTMGGLVMIVAVVAGYFAGHLSVFTRGVGFEVNWTTVPPGGWLVLLAFVGMGAIGFADDWSKIRAERNLGLNKRTKFGGQVLIAGLFAWGAISWAGLEPDIGFVRPLGIGLPPILFGAWVLLMLTATANGVNLADGLDGLAAGSGALVFGAYTIMAYWIFRNPGFYGPDLALDLSALDLARFGAALFAATLGFLWWNAAPAQIFMGDVGSQSLGGALAAMAVLTYTHLLLVVIGGLFVWETITVILQVAAFRTTGRRIFRMTPIHHAFELRGWPETAIIVRFWIIAAICVAVGLGLFYGDFVVNSGGSL